MNLKHTTSHTCICTVRWNTLRKLKLCDFWWMDWWKMKILLLVFSVISLCSETKQISSASPPPHPHSDLQTVLNSSPLSCAVGAGGGGGRRWRLTCLKHELQVGVRSAGVDISPITSIHPLSCCFSENQEDNGVSRSPVQCLCSCRSLTIADQSLQYHLEVHFVHLMFSFQLYTVRLRPLSLLFVLSFTEVFCSKCQKINQNTQSTKDI